MANEDHKMLSDFIKGVHNELRLQFQSCKHDVDVNELWDQHCKRTDMLSTYSSAMHRLANIHWKRNNSSTRIDWCYNTIMDYFENGGMERVLRRDHRLQVVRRNNVDIFNKINTENAKIKVLDVGSCYNPFSEYDNLMTVAVDICPATPNVHKCDFLKLKVVPQQEDESDISATNLPSHITALPEGSFHVVVFSLLLEYLPSQYQRLHCCMMAEKLLMENGLLLIVTPDSKHQNYNAKMMKSWKHTLESLGLRRVKYEKQPHLHCLAFYKAHKDLETPFQSVSACDLHGLYIPQDLRRPSQTSLPRISITIDPEDAKQTFLELPDFSCLE